MKRNYLLSYLLLAVLCLGFVSCSDDDDDDNNTSIVGTWVITDSEVDVVTNNDEFTKAFIELVRDEYAGDKGSKSIFTQDGKCIVDVDSEYADTLSYTYSNGEITFVYEKYNETGITPFIIRGNTATSVYDVLEDDGDGMSSDIRYLIRKNESLKDLDPDSIKVSKCIVKDIFSKQ